MASTDNIDRMVIDISVEDNATDSLASISKEIEAFSKSVASLQSIKLPEFKLPEVSLSKTTEKIKEDIETISTSFQKAFADVATFKPADFLNVNEFENVTRQVETAVTAVNNAKDRVAKSTLAYEQAINNVTAAEENAIRAKELYNNILNNTNATKEQTIRAEQQYLQAVQKQAQEENRLVMSKSNLEKSTMSLESAMRRLDTATDEASKKGSLLNTVWEGVSNTFSKKSFDISDSLKSIFSLAKLTASIAAGRKLGRTVQELADASGAWVENLHLLEVAFGKNHREAKRFVDEMNRFLLLDKNQLAQYVATFQQMGTAMGIASDTATIFSELLTQVALDQAALRNVDYSQAISNFESAIAGMVRPVRKYGLDITMRSIEESLKAFGMNVKYTALTGAQKQLANAVVLINSSRSAWGDLAKTINTFANQSRLVQSNLMGVKRALGDVLVGTVGMGLSFDEASKSAGIATRALWHLNGGILALISIIRMFVKESDTVDDALDDMGESGKNAGDGLGEGKDALDGFLASFDKFETLSTPKMADGGDEAVTKQLADILAQLQEEYDAVAKHARETNSYAVMIKKDILDILGFIEDTNGELSFTEDSLAEKIFKAVNNIKKAFDNLKETVKPIYKELKNMFNMFGLGTFLKLMSESEELSESLVNLLTGLGAVLAIIKIIKNTNPFGIMLTMLSVLIATTPELLEDFGEIGSMIIESIKPLLKAVGSIAKSLSPIIVAVAKAIMPAIKIIVKLVNSLLPPLVKILDTALKILEPIIEIAGIVVDALGDSLDDLMPIIVFILETVNDLARFLMHLIKPVVDLIVVATKTLFDYTSKVRQAIASMLAPFEKIYDKVKDIGKKIFGWDIDDKNFKKLENIFGVLLGMITGITLGLKNMLPSNWGLFKSQKKKAEEEEQRKAETLNEMSEIKKMIDEVWFPSDSWGSLRSGKDYINKHDLNGLLGSQSADLGSGQIAGIYRDDVSRVAPTSAPINVSPVIEIDGRTLGQVISPYVGDEFRRTGILKSY